jgi:anti-sigma regulatory factor (Ser/Thr protein kinase)
MSPDFSGIFYDKHSRQGKMTDRILTIENAVLDDIPRVIEFVVSWLQGQGQGKYSFPVETAVDEASTNVIKHAYGGKGGFFEISCDMQGSDIVIRIRDRGSPFDPGSVPQPDVSAGLEDRKIGGLGIYIMKKMMDEVNYSFDIEQGNRLEMRKTTTSPG